MTLVVEDEPLVRSVIVRALQQLGFRTIETDNATDAVRELACRSFALLLTDLDLAGVPDGLVVLRAARQSQPACVRVLMSGSSAADMASATERGLAQRVLEKPISLHDLAVLRALV